MRDDCWPNADDLFTSALGTLLGVTGLGIALASPETHQRLACRQQDTGSDPIDP